ncbi:kinesin-like protein Klp59C [Drosophila guanche]|uniref:Kinesin-like protein n=1 Tax=Drosophila guanche TaxID=7266 RepID=A0A3B0K7Q2_DROGU|nr:kinesin-like protein Klp59C [Drosophila guanche]SPP88702.1 blast:Kinesin-like protein Klp59C [Drosophila guanche]
MDLLAIGQSVMVQRSNGETHRATITRLNAERDIVSVQWTEADGDKGKDLLLDRIIETNPEIFAPKAVVPPAPTKTLSQPQPQPELQPLPKPQPQPQSESQLQVEVTTPTPLLLPEDPQKPDTETLVRYFRKQLVLHPLVAVGLSGPMKASGIMVCVRKRPLNPKEVAAREVDVISLQPPNMLVVHLLRLHVYREPTLDHQNFCFDRVFDENCSNAGVFNYTARPLIRHIFEGGWATCFAYGQTGSGKTHTMGGVVEGKNQNVMDSIYAMAASEVFSIIQEPESAERNLSVGCSFFEIYNTKIYDLLSPGNKQPLRLQENCQYQMEVMDLIECPTSGTAEVLALLNTGNGARALGKTSANEKSSRSHAIFQIVLRSAISKETYGKFSLVDLAGSERAVDNFSSNSQTCTESAEINKSLLLLKECIHAMGRKSSYIPFRDCKLTQVLRDSFIGKNVKTCMIATIAPGMCSVNSTLNTLRYANRVKELKVQAPVVPPMPPLTAQLSKVLESDATEKRQAADPIGDIPTYTLDGQIYCSLCSQPVTCMPVLCPYFGLSNKKPQ